MPENEITRLEGVVQPYDWGSRRFLAALRGEPPSERPEAELWLGAHERGEARVVLASGQSHPLRAWIARDPEGVLGARVVARHGPRLPFLLKLLAVERALSLQVHPDPEQARAGFEHEERAGLPAAQRLYADAAAKPELVLAHTRFEALCGFRPLGEIRAGFAKLGLEDLAPAAEADAESWLRGFVAYWLGALPRDRLAAAVERSAAAASGDPALAWVERLAEQHPGDPGVLAPLLLRHMVLEPGEALFLEAGELHCYLAGAAAEIMASSDNVLRAGLTTKTVAVGELLRVGRFAPRPPHAVRAEDRSPGVHVYATPAAEFELARIEVGASGVAIEARSGVEILLCHAGRVRVAPAGGGSAVTLRSGQSCLVPASLAAYRLEGESRLYRAAVPENR